jgi:hypothetical protein
VTAAVSTPPAAERSGISWSKAAIARLTKATANRANFPRSPLSQPVRKYQRTSNKQARAQSSYCCVHPVHDPALSGGIPLRATRIMMAPNLSVAVPHFASRKELFTIFSFNDSFLPIHVDVKFGRSAARSGSRASCLSAYPATRCSAVPVRPADQQAAEVVMATIASPAALINKSWLKGGRMGK